MIIPNRESDQLEMRTRYTVFAKQLIKSDTQNKNAFMKENQHSRI